MNIEAYRTTEISKIPNRLGIYAWFIAYDYKTDHIDYHNIFRSASIISTVEGIFNDVYTGEIDQKPFSFDKGICFSPFINKAVDAFCPPLYIGISSNLQNRLYTHRNKLNDLLHSRKEFKYEKDAEVDSDAESSNFAIRLANILERTKSISLRNLRIKVVVANEDVTREDVFAVEKYLNRTYLPIYGRK